ncbi:MAG: formylglycine-generating enzyme family protein, partial [Thermoguttaceae bacterium]|nr:formylglycine-generating enzyme family protein [Thermoguttaceae bacterium]
NFSENAAADQESETIIREMTESECQGKMPEARFMVPSMFETTEEWQERMESYDRFVIGRGDLQYYYVSTGKFKISLHFLVRAAYYLPTPKKRINLEMEREVAKKLFERSRSYSITAKFALVNGYLRFREIQLDCGDIKFDITDEINEQVEFGEGEEEGDELSVVIAGLTYSFRWCPKGDYIMGSPRKEWGESDLDVGHNTLDHKVSVDRGFWMLSTPVTQYMYYIVMEENPSRFSAVGTGQETVDGLTTYYFPVESVTWEEANEFCEKLTKLANLTSEKFVLPSEVQWEYACRAGTNTPFAYGDKLNSRQANFDHVFDRPVPVMTYKPNAWGLFDMHGNVAEWCSDFCGEFVEPKSEYDLEMEEARSEEDEDAEEDSEAEDSETSDDDREDDLISYRSRVVRGGSWNDTANVCRSAYRNWNIESDRNSTVGFRVILVPLSPEELKSSGEDSAESEDEASSSLPGDDE